MNTKNRKLDGGIKNQGSDINVTAIISAHSEDDIIYHVIGDSIKQGIDVYLTDHCSTNNTVQGALKWLGEGLIHIVHYPEDAGYAQENKTSIYGETF